MTNANVQSLGYRLSVTWGEDKHPQLTPFQLKSVLHLTATNVGGAA